MFIWALNRLGDAQLQAGGADDTAAGQARQVVTLSVSSEGAGSHCVGLQQAWVGRSDRVLLKSSSAAGATLGSRPGFSQCLCTFMQQMQHVSRAMDSLAAAAWDGHMLQLTLKYAHADLGSLMHLFVLCMGQAALQDHSNGPGWS